MLTLRRKESVFDQSADQIIQGNTIHCLQDFKAIQLIREWVQGNKHSYDSYELNLVFGDGNRLNMTDHGDLQLIRSDADALGRYLDIPIWDAIDFKIPKTMLSGLELRANILNRLG